MQLGNMSQAQINKLRAKFGMPPLGQEGMLDKVKKQAKAKPKAKRKPKPKTQLKGLKEAEAKAKAAQKKTPVKQAPVKQAPVKKAPVKQATVQRQSAAEMRAEQEARRQAAIQRRQAEEEQARAARRQAEQEAARRQAERTARSKAAWAEAAAAKKAEKEAKAAAGIVEEPKKTANIQFSNMSNKDINNLREKFGKEKLSEQEATKVREGMLESGQMSGEKVLASPGSAAYQKQKAADPAWVAQKEAERDIARGAVQNKNVMQENASGRPEGVSQWLWDRAMGGNLEINPTLITRNPAVRDALIAAGKEDYVKAMYERHMDNNAAHAIGNGLDAGSAWAQASGSVDDWYSQNYGDYSNETVAGSTGASGADDFTFGGGTTPEGTDDQPYVPPAPPQPPVGGGGGGNGGGNGGGEGDPPPIDSGPEDPGPDPIVLDPLGSTNMTTRSGANSFMAGRSQGLLNPNHAPMPMRQPSAASPGMPTAVRPEMPSRPQSTPFADAYLKAKAAAEAPGPVSKLFANELKGC